jgi:hypothetical protein
MQSLPFRISSLLLLLPLLSGCIGIEVFFPKNEPAWVKPRTDNSVGTRSGFPPSYGYPATEEDPGTSCTEVIAQRGEPDHRSVDGRETTLVYRHGVAWAGIMPIIIFPIPVGLPVFPDYVTYTCKEDVLISVYQITTRTVGAVCGMLDEGGRWGCDARAFGD